MFLFDGPLSNLDAELRVDMRVEIARLHKEIGATMIYVTHDLVGAPMDLYRGPDNRFVASFIGSPR